MSHRPPSKHQLALMIRLAVFPTLVVLNLALSRLLRVGYFVMGVGLAVAGWPLLFADKPWGWRRAPSSACSWRCRSWHCSASGTPNGCCPPCCSKDLRALNIAGALPSSVAPGIAPAILTIGGGYAVLYAVAGSAPSSAPRPSCP
jgi:hypothetical protein